MHLVKGKLCHCDNLDTFRLHFMYAYPESVNSRMKEMKSNLKCLREYGRDRYKAVV